MCSFGEMEKEKGKKGLERIDTKCRDKNVSESPGNELSIRTLQNPYCVVSYFLSQKLEKKRILNDKKDTIDWIKKTGWTTLTLVGTE